MALSVINTPTLILPSISERKSVLGILNSESQFSNSFICGACYCECVCACDCYEGGSCACDCSCACY